MRTILPVCGGSDAGEPRSLRSRVGRMKRLLWLRQSQCMGVHMNTEPGVWLRSFQFLDTDGQCEVSLEFCSNVEKRLVSHSALCNSGVLFLVHCQQLCFTFSSK